MKMLTLPVCFVVLLVAADDHGILHVSAAPAKLSLTWKDGDAVRTSELHLSRDHPVDTLSSAYRICNELGIGIGNVEKVAETIESAINGQQTATGDGHSRTRLLSVLVETFSLKHYLEIGCRDDHNFAPMKTLGLEHTTCVDPNEGGTHRMTSDKFFQQKLHLFNFDNGTNTRKETEIGGVLMPAAARIGFSMNRPWSRGVSSHLFIHSMLNRT